MTTTRYFWDPVEDNIVQERNETGIVEVAYTTEPQHNGFLIARSLNGVEGQCHFDAVGSLLAVTDYDQLAVTLQDYSAFGTATVHVGANAGAVGFAGRHGYYLEQYSGQLNVRRRVYGAIVGRWLTCDPLLHVDGVNGFAYAHNAPSLFIDPSGLICIAVSTTTGKWKVAHFGAAKTEALTDLAGSPSTVKHSRVTVLQCVYTRDITTTYRCPSKCFDPPKQFPGNTCTVTCPQVGTSEPGALHIQIFVTGAAAEWTPPFWPQGLPGGITIWSISGFDTAIDKRNAKAECEADIGRNRGKNIGTPIGSSPPPSIEKRSELNDCNSDCPIK